jgi:hypothetical protein
MPRIGQTITHVKVNEDEHPIDAMSIEGKSKTAFQESGKLVTTISASSDDQHYPSAKCLYDIIGDLYRHRI